MSRPERYDEVVSVAAKVFAERGYRATSVAHLASELGMTAAALYYYMDSKVDLLVEVCNRAGAELQDAATKIVQSDLTPAEQLHLFIRRHLQVILENRAGFTIMFQERSELPEEYRTVLLQHERVYLDKLEEILARFDTAQVRTGERRIVALASTGMLNWTLRWYRDDGPHSLDEVANTYCELILHGYLGDEPLGKRVGKVSEVQRA